ncbi:MAG TPA: hypothetical protein PLB18_22705, partial [Acidobacteriota bacterium]|nr:hypothetical protein [Acidobacteriota bacterium]
MRLTGYTSPFQQTANRWLFFGVVESGGSTHPCAVTGPYSPQTFPTVTSISRYSHPRGSAIPWSKSQRVAETN